MIEIDGITYYSVTDISSECGYTFCSIWREVKALKMETIKYKNNRLFTLEQKKQLVDIMLQKAENKPKLIAKVKNNKDQKLTIEELRALHPLVKDDRFLGNHISRILYQMYKEHKL